VLGENPNTTFLSFGSSGKTADAVCTNLRGDFREKSYIFDIVTTSVMEKLDETSATNKFGREFYECVGTERVYGMRESQYLELESITDFINKRLIVDLD